MNITEKINKYLNETGKPKSKTAKNIEEGDNIYKFGVVDMVSRQNHIIIVYSGKKKKIFDENESVTLV